MNFAIVIPAYNEEATIRAVVIGAMARSNVVIVVDDGSSDRTGEIVAELPVVLLRHEENRGKAQALWSGFERALAGGADAVVTMDGDGQHRADEVPRFVRAHADHPHCVVIGARMRRVEGAPRARRFANRFADFWVSWAAGHRIADSQSGMRLYPAEILRRARVAHDSSRAFTLESEILIDAAKRGHRTVAVAIDAIYGCSPRPSHFRPVRDISRIVVMIAGHLLRSGMNLRGLYRSRRESPLIVDTERRTDEDGIAGLENSRIRAVER